MCVILTHASKFPCKKPTVKLFFHCSHKQKKKKQQNLLLSNIHYQALIWDHKMFLRTSGGLCV